MTCEPESATVAKDSLLDFRPRSAGTEATACLTTLSPDRALVVAPFSDLEVGWPQPVGLALR